MMIQLQPDKIVEVWPGIKEGIAQVGRLLSNREEYLPNVLASLLAGKYQLWVVMNEERNIQALLITCLAEDALTGEKLLSVDVGFGYRKSSDKFILEHWETLREYAAAHDCDYVKATTNVERAAEICKLVGAEEVSRNYVVRLR